MASEGWVKMKNKQTKTLNITPHPTLIFVLSFRPSCKSTQDSELIRLCLWLKNNRAKSALGGLKALFSSPLWIDPCWHCMCFPALETQGFCGRAFTPHPPRKEQRFSGVNWGFPTNSSGLLWSWIFLPFLFFEMVWIKIAYSRSLEAYGPAQNFKQNISFYNLL